MVDLRVLEQQGSTREALRELFTAKAPNRDHFDLDNPEEKARFEKLEKRFKLRGKIEERTSNRLDDAITTSLKNYQIFGAVDLAWDAPPITKETHALILWAQGRLTTKGCLGTLGTLGCAQKYVQKNKKGETTGFDLPKFFETNINLVRSMVTRRLAAQTNKFNNLYPNYKYHPRGTSRVAKLYSDVVGEVVEQQVDSFNHRHQDEQAMRAMFLYNNTVAFVRSAWETENSTQFKQLPEGVDVTPGQDRELESRVEREGVCFVVPHASRIFKDPAAPWSSLNSGTGIDWCGYWDLEAYRNVGENPDFYNRDELTYSSGYISLFDQYGTYFNQYYCNISVPSRADLTPLENDAKSQIGRYSADKGDSACLIAVVFMKVRPIDWGVGEYAEQVWVRLVTAGSDGTVVYAEFLPSAPGAHCGHNSNDSRDLNLSFALEMMPFQDQLTNLFTQLLSACKYEQFKMVEVDRDVVSDNAVFEEIKKTMQGHNWFAKPFVLGYAGSKAKQLDLPVGGPSKQSPVTIIGPDSKPQAISIIIAAIGDVMRMAERIAVMSPNESGQPIVRGNGGVTATEAAQIEQTTSAVYNFVSDSIDAYRAAKKKILYESWVNFGEDEFLVTVPGRYTRDTVERSGLEIVDVEIRDGRNEGLVFPTRWTLKGKKHKLVQYEYVFSSRDGAERMANVQAATTMIQLLPILKDPEIYQQVGRAKFFEIVNEIIRLSGSGMNLVLDPDEEVEQQAPPELQQIKESIDHVLSLVEGNTTTIEQLQKAVTAAAQQRQRG